MSHQINKKLVILDILRSYSPLTIPQILKRFQKLHPKIKISKSEIRLILWRVMKKIDWIIKEDFSGDRVSTRYSVDYEKLPENDLKAIDFSIIKKLLLMMMKGRMESKEILGEYDFNQLEIKRIQSLIPLVKKEFLE